ncbi:hypothetical protein GLOTRDRAFT_96361 [Gloeophyllum trabeum ATCC 11539]|uniref:Uncharacterized protein n=1 Tax=Gloeophyllum trabeum (strain ATCC 11539 / FP-39264 / Madison 617) TaxID=670483 RepID=S7RBM6_GLOTA|nr:uncharacterized protein GLOTRDRAFT_96361 [Gloeophyllum trabeum ATCC 11539]EPQ51645.1 hypothetical protein GLOTRDRAFT_96361 [Gloeophyllum trabeum ATCC 11539]
MSFSFDDTSKLLPQQMVLVPSFLAFVSAYHFLTGTRELTAKQRSWILTTLASAIVTLASFPFVWDYVRNDGDISRVRHSPGLAYATTRIFQGYLISDISMGLIYYREQVGLLTGWVHHSLYILVVELAIRRSWAHIFCLCGIMELPTFVLSIASLNPVFRSNVTFALSFFATRILLHLVLIVSYLLPGNRMRATGGSFVPAAVLALVFPMHAVWFTGCIKGFIKRQRAKKQPTPSATVIHLEVSSERQAVPVPTPAIVPIHASEPRAENTTPLQALPTQPARPTLPAKLVRRLSFEKALRKMEIDRARQRIREARRLLYEVLPPRERVYDYFGLGRGQLRYDRAPGVGGEELGRMVAVY